MFIGLQINRSDKTYNCGLGVYSSNNPPVGTYVGWYGQSATYPAPAALSPIGGTTNAGTCLTPDPDCSGIVADLSNIELPTKQLGNFIVKY